MKYEAVIFDLDGTLVNSLQDLANAVNFAMNELGQPKHELEAFRYLVGQGLRNMIKDSLGREFEEKTDEGMKLFHKHYDVHQYDNTKPYEGVAQMLQRLCDAGMKVCILSNKPDAATKSVVGHLLKGIEFSIVRGQREGIPIKPNPIAVLEMTEQLGVDPEKIVYVGDSKVDMLTGKSAGLYTIGVSWGFRDIMELQQNGADVIVDDTEQLLDAIL